jgi:hypothetical protein
MSLTIDDPSLELAEQSPGDPMPDTSYPLGSCPFESYAIASPHRLLVHTMKHAAPLSAHDETCSAC